MKQTRTRTHIFQLSATGALLRTWMLQCATCSALCHCRTSGRMEALQGPCGTSLSWDRSHLRSGTATTAVGMNIHLQTMWTWKIMENHGKPWKIMACHEKNEGHLDICQRLKSALRHFGNLPWQLVSSILGHELNISTARSGRTVSVSDSPAHVSCVQSKTPWWLISGVLGFY